LQQASPYKNITTTRAISTNTGVGGGGFTYLVLEI
tara:strand:- start:903 stop:1007 length:105 start_codon:yes stop_codon:yes gene_type:complete